MTTTCRQLFTIAAVTLLTNKVFAVPVAFTQHLPGGFNVSVNGGPLVASGPITVTGIVDSTAPDIDPLSSRGEFPLSTVSFTGAGFVEKQVVTPLSLLIISDSRELFAFQLVGKYNQGIMGWDDITPPGTIAANPNDLSSLSPLPLTIYGTGTFWYQALGGNAWELDGGNTIGANLGGYGPTGIFSINAIPEPSALALSVITFLLSAGLRRRAS